MEFARIYIPKENKQEDVKIECIPKFWKIYGRCKGDIKNEAFTLERSSGKKIRCQVLLIAGEWTSFILTYDIVDQRYHIYILSNWKFFFLITIIRNASTDVRYQNCSQHLPCVFESKTRPQILVRLSLRSAEWPVGDLALSMNNRRLGY